jgi:tetratricopeptide (TPR) repeat protein
MIHSMKALVLAASMACLSLAQTPGQTAAPQKAGAQDTQGEAYYHFAMGRLYAGLASSADNQSEYITKAIQNYQDALKLDPNASIILDELTDLYMQTGRMQDAINEAQDLLKQNPDNLEARRMLGRIYTRSIANVPGNRINEEMVKSAIDQYKQIVQKDPKDADSWVTLGRLYGVSNNTAEAEKAYDAALKAQPDNEDALTGVAMLYADMGDNQRAIDKLKEATSKAPNSHTLSALAEAYERVHDYKNAAAVLKRAVELDPDNTRLQAGLAQDLLFGDQLDEAMPLYQQLAEDDPREPEYQLRIAQIYRAKHELGKARQALNKAKQMDPSNMDLIYEDVNLLEAEGKNDDAITEMKSLIDSTARRTYTAAQSANRAQLLERLGTLYRGASQYTEAIDALRQAATLDPDSGARISVLIVDTYRQARDLANAQREADQALKKYPDERMVQITHAETLGDLGKIDDAVAEIKASAKGGVLDREMQLEIAQIYEKGKRWTDMGKALDAAEKLCKTEDQKSAVYFMRGAMYERMKKYDQAEAEFRKVIQLNGQDANTLNYLGYMLADRGVRLNEAQDLIQKALDIDPQNGAFLDSMGWVYYRQGKLEQAEQLLTQALDHMGDDPTVHDHLGDVYFKLGKTREAIAQWQTSVKEYQTSPPSDSDPDALAKVSNKLESARVRLAKETNQSAK